jgi:hypothetical protein
MIFHHQTRSESVGWLGWLLAALAWLVDDRHTRQPFFSWQKETETEASSATGVKLKTVIS